MISANYRPISILPVLSKILEKLVHKRLINYLDKYELFNIYKAFKKGNPQNMPYQISTKTQLKLLKKRKHVLFSSILLRHLIYTVNHKILLNKVEYYGARGVLLIWFQSYLHNRQQCVKINQSTSDSKTITCGVPQGSILKPLLFLININDIFLAAPKVSFHLFADDTCIFHSNKNYKKLEDEINTSLDNITNW